MNLTYNNFAIHNIGDFSLSQSREYESGDSDTAQRCKVTLHVIIDVFRDAFGDNYGLFLQLKEALRTQHAELQWTNTDTNEDYVNQTAQLTACDLPEDPNGWGSWHQQFNCTFVYYEQDLLTNNQPLTLLRNGSANPFDLGNLRKWAESATAERFSPLFSTRKRTGGRIVASGFFFTPAAAALTVRRTNLLAFKTTYDATMNGCDGVLSFGAGGAAFQRTVRIEEYTAEIDQAINSVAWSFTASYTAFPNLDDPTQSGMAAAEFNVDQKDGQNGEQFLTLSGKISAPDETTARLRLAAIRTAILAQYGFDTAQVQVLRDDSNVLYVGNEGQAGGGRLLLPEGGGLELPGGGGVILP